VIAQYADAAPEGGKVALIRRGEPAFRKLGTKVCDLFVGDYVADHEARFLRDMAGWVAAGQVKYREDIRQGIETVPAVFAEMMTGGNFGKTLVQVAEDPTRSKL